MTPGAVGSKHRSAIHDQTSAISMMRPFRTQSMRTPQPGTALLVPGWYEPSRWDEEASPPSTKEPQRPGRSRREEIPHVRQHQVQAGWRHAEPQGELAEVFVAARR